MLGLAQLLFVGLVVFFVFVVVLIARTIGRPPRRTYASAVSRNLPGDPGELDPPREFTSWTFAHGTGRDSTEMPVWEIPGDAPDGPTVIMTHGWGDSRIGSLIRLDAVLPFASRVLAWDMPGQGEASGRASLGVHEAEALRTLLDEAQVDRAVLFGWSMGAGVSIAMAAKDDRVISVIAEAPYRHAITPAKNVLRLRRMPGGPAAYVAFWILGIKAGIGPGWRGFDRAEHASHLGCPLFVLHGEHDLVSPIADARAIVEAAPNAELCDIPDAGHNTLWTDPSQREQSIAATRSFLHRTLAGTGGHAASGEAETPAVSGR